MNPATVLDAITCEIEVEAPPGLVFAAWTDPEQLAAWWGSAETYRTSNWKIDLRPGGSWSCNTVGATGTVSTVHGVYKEIDPPRLLSFTWNPSWAPEPETLVRITFEPAQSGTRISVVHSGFTNPQARQGHSDGWKRVFGWVGEYLRKNLTTRG